MGSIVFNCCSEHRSDKDKSRISVLRKNDNQKLQQKSSKLKDNDLEHQLFSFIEQYNKKPNGKDQYSIDDFEIIGSVGSGSFGTVLLGRLNSINKNYAIKKVSKQIMRKQRILESAKLDLKLLSTKQCKFIIPLETAFHDQHYIYQVMEFGTGGDTYGLISYKSSKRQQFKQLGQPAVRFIAACVILGLQYLHNHNIMYRDLKPENVLICENGYAKLTDFGLSKESLEPEQSKTMLGSIYYLSPQMVQKNSYTKDIDIWALGVYLYELSVFEPPFRRQLITYQRFKTAVQEAQVNRNWGKAKLSQGLKDLINGLLKLDPKKRLGADKNFNQIKNHKFFEKFDWKSLQLQQLQSPLKELVTNHSILKKFNSPESEDQLKKQGWTYLKSYKRQ